MKSAMLSSRGASCWSHRRNVPATDIRVSASADLACQNQRKTSPDIAVGSGRGMTYVRRVSGFWVHERVAAPDGPTS